MELFGVKIARESAELVVTRFGIRNTAQIAGRGRLVHGAFERAAIALAKEAGASSVRLESQMVVNATWRAYLESLGYTKFLPKDGPAVFMKVFKL